MTRDRDNKRAVRSRMRATGERYTQARSALFGSSVGKPPTRSRLDAEGGAMLGKELLASLDRDGYAVVRRAIPKHTIDELRRWADELVHANLDSRVGDARRRQEAGEPYARAFPLGSDGVVLLEIEDDARLAPLVRTMDEIAGAIGTPRRRSTGIAATLPGWGGHSGLHQDLSGPAPEIGQWDGAIFT